MALGTILPWCSEMLNYLIKHVSHYIFVSFPLLRAKKSKESLSISHPSDCRCSWKDYFCSKKYFSSRKIKFLCCVRGAPIHYNPRLFMKLRPKYVSKYSKDFFVERFYPHFFQNFWVKKILKIFWNVLKKIRLSWSHFFFHRKLSSKISKFQKLKMQILLNDKNQKIIFAYTFLNVAHLLEQ